MRFRYIVATAALSVAAPGAVAQETHSKFQFDASRVPVGAMYRYVKSNLDGSHASEIAVYVAGIDRVESFKWSPGQPGAVLVAATMSWRTYSARKLESWRISPAGARALQATLEQVDQTDRYALTLGPVRDTSHVAVWPWHSYDFDFAGLGLTLPHLVDPRSSFTIGIADAGGTPEGPRFIDKGPVTVRFTADEPYLDMPARKYRIDGKGLDHRGGYLWTAIDGGHLIGFEIQLPDEDGMESGKLALREVARLTAGEWTAFQQHHAAGRSP